MSSGSGKQTLGYKYYVGMHMVLCSGPVDLISRIRVDRKLAWEGIATGGQITLDAEDLFGGTRREGGVSGRVDFEPGDDAQDPNDYLLEKLGALVPAFRKVAALVLRQVYVGLNPYLKTWDVRAQRIHTRQNGIEQWYPAKAAIGSDCIPVGSDTVSAFDHIALQCNGTALTFWVNGELVDSATLSFTPNGGVGGDCGIGKAFYNIGTHGFYGYLDNVRVTKAVRYTGSFTPSTAVPGAGTDAHWSDVIVCLNMEGADGSTTFTDEKGSPWTLTGAAHVETTAAASGNASGLFRGGFLTTPYTSGLNLGSVFTIDLWVRTGTIDTCLIAMNVESGVHEGYTIGTDSDGNYYGRVGSNAVGTTTHYWQPSSDPSFKVYTEDHVYAAQQIALHIWGGLYTDLTYLSPSSYRVGYYGYSDVMTAYSTGEVPDESATVTLVTSPQLSSQYFDMNPAHIVRECLTDPDWGMGYTAEDCSTAFFEKAADTLFEEFFGMSLLWDQQTVIEDFITEVLRTIDAALYVDNRDGLWKIKLIRDDYEVEALPVLDPSNVGSIEEFTRPAIGDLINQVTVKYWDQLNSATGAVTVTNDALVQMQGQIVSQTVTYDGITNRCLAARVAQRDLQTLGRPLASCKLTAHRSTGTMQKGDPFVLQWPDYGLGDGIVMRVTRIDYGEAADGRVRIECVEDVFAMPSAPVLTGSTSGWTSPVSAAEAVAARVAIEAPYYLLVLGMTQANVDTLLTDTPEVGFIAVTGARPASDALNAVLAIDAGAGYAEAGITDFCPSAVLAADLALAAGPTSVAITDAEDLEDVALGSFAQIGNELVRVDALSDTSATLGRGLLDTLPAAHSSGDRLFILQDYASGDDIQYVDGEDIDVKLLTVTGTGKLAAADAPADTISMASRAIRPYPPGNLKINGSYYPATIGGSDQLALTWAHRDRTQETGGTLADFADASIGPEAGVTYTLRLYGEDGSTLLRTVTGLSAANYTYLHDDEVADSDLLDGTITQSYDSVINGDGPRAYWRLGESSGTTMNDASGNGWNGTYHNSPTLGATGVIPGDTAVTWPGTNQYAEVAHNTALNPGSLEWAVEFWAKWTSTVQEYVFSKANAVTAPYPGPTILVNHGTSEGTATGYVYCRDKSTTGYKIVSATGGMNDGGWRHFVFQRRLVSTGPDVWKLEIWINGTLNASVTLSSVTALTDTANLELGGWPAAGGYYFTGTMDEVAYYVGKALTPTEIAAHHAAQSGSVDVYRLNGKLRFELEARRSTYTSRQKYNLTVYRTGYGFNYGNYYG
jgi:hypothetical protein